MHPSPRLISTPSNPYAKIPVGRSARQLPADRIGSRCHARITSRKRTPASWETHVIHWTEERVLLNAFYQERPWVTRMAQTALGYRITDDGKVEKLHA